MASWWGSTFGAAAFSALLAGAGPAWADASGAVQVITCKRLSAVDGDTVRCDGELLRDMGDGAPFVSGFDTPELRKPGCPDERALAQRAKKRYAELLRSPGVTIMDSGARDTTSSHRRLVWIYLADGRALGSILIQEGLAREWRPGTEPEWCN